MTAHVTVCGTLTVARGGDHLSGPSLGTRKARVLVAALAAGRGAAVPSARLAEAVWPEDPPRDPAANLTTLVSRIRRTVGEGFVVPGSASYGLGHGVALDLDIAGDMVAAAVTRVSRGEPTLAVASATAALQVLGSEDLAEECRGEWADPMRQEATGLRREARHLLAAAALATGQAELARAAAQTAAGADPYDERAHRDLICALVADGQTAAAPETLGGLVARLRDELGTDPDAETRRLGRARFILVSGVPGIGKTRLLAEAAAVAGASGGSVLTARCRPAERSLFLQPFVEVLRPVLRATPEPLLRTLLGSHLQAWVRLVPELGELFGAVPESDVSRDLARKRSFDAVVAVLAGLAARRPVLLEVDDLQYGADVTADLLAHLSTSLGNAPVLLLAAVRSDGLSAVGHLTGLAERIDLGPLPPSAVGALASAAGFPTRADEVQARTHGHPLSVVASLQALASGTEGVPDSLGTAVRGQVALLGPDLIRLVEAASVLGTRVAPSTLAGLADRPEVDVVLGCESLVAAGLLVRADAEYEFVNDLVRDAVTGSLPRALAVAYHRRAADLLADRPEAMAGHAHAAEEHERAARGYLEAGRRARRSAALDDAVALLGAALDDARTTENGVLVATVLLERARAVEARSDYAGAAADAVAARDLLAGHDEPRLELRILRMLVGDVAIGCHRPPAELVENSERGVRRSAELGDTAQTAFFRSRIAALECSRLRLGRAYAVASAGVAEARAVGSPEARARALDGLKTVLTYCGDGSALQLVLDELVPLLERLGATWLLQWAVLESATVPAASGDWAEARARIDRALAINRETGYGAYAGFILARRAWLARWAGDLDTALADGRTALAETAPIGHPWWFAAAVGTHASTLLELGRPDEAAELCHTGLDALGAEAGAAYRLLCLAPLTAATGEGLEEADRLVAAIEAPPGRAWVPGADAYVTLAAAWTRAGEADRASRVVGPLLEATATSWAEIHARLVQRTSATSSAARSAPSRGTGT